MNLPFKKLHPDAVAPTYAHDGDAGVDLCSVADLTIPPGGHAAVPTGIALELPVGFEGQVRPRSGYAARNGVTVLNSPGTIDCGYRGEVKVILINHGKEPFVITKRMKIAQLVIAPVTRVTFAEAADLSDSARGAGGFGSSGTH